MCTQKLATVFKRGIHVVENGLTSQVSMLTSDHMCLVPNALVRQIKIVQGGYIVKDTLTQFVKGFECFHIHSSKMKTLHFYKGIYYTCDTNNNNPNARSFYIFKSVKQYLPSQQSNALLHIVTSLFTF